MGWDEMRWDGMGWDGMGWDGMGWDGMSTPDCAGCVSTLKFGRKRVFNKVETFFSKVVHSSPIPHLQNTRRGKRTFLGKKMKILWHLAMFAENDGGGLLCQTPDSLNFSEVFSSFCKEVEKSL